MIENVEVQVSNALSFRTSHHLLRSVEDKAYKSCLKNGRLHKIFIPLIISGSFFLFLTYGNYK